MNKALIYLMFFLLASMVKASPLNIQDVTTPSMPTSGGLSAGSNELSTSLNLADKPQDVGMLRRCKQNRVKLQRGATFFMNYCSGCHALRYMRYSQMANDLGITNLHDPIQISMPQTDARQWFGRVPPDLSLSARYRGTDWLTNYLKSFYADKSRPFGTNNRLVPHVLMPNVLFPLEVEMSQSQFNDVIQDLVTFLVYVGEPAKLIRYRIGFGVMGFLVLFLIVVWRLKKIYWRNIR